jgi:1-hydroxycarotenoid 3,4-desaturase
VRGLDLAHHTVFFGDDYADEFRAIFARREIGRSPTVYVCAQDRGEAAASPVTPGSPERLLLLINAPADGDRGGVSEAALMQAGMDAFASLRRCGLELGTAHDSPEAVITRPQDFEALFPCTGGSLYGRANHGMLASFQRSGSRSKVPGLYLAGGSVHPGPGIPMATLSGRLAAAAVLQDAR